MTREARYAYRKLRERERAYRDYGNRALENGTISDKFDGEADNVDQHDKSVYYGPQQQPLCLFRCDLVSNRNASMSSHHATALLRHLQFFPLNGAGIRTRRSTDHLLSRSCYYCIYHLSMFCHNYLF